MRFIEGIDSRQMRLGIWSIEEEVAENSPARFVEVFVDSLDVGELGFKRAEPAHTGRPAYAPQDLIKLYLYGYLNGIRSSRKLERECGRNIELFYLLNRLCPDHNTIADFRKENRKALKKVFQSDRGALLFTDPEAGMMPAKEGGIKACYNVQTAVDAGSH